jgi:peptidyl-prolyl cis-trans isomerase C
LRALADLDLPRKMTLSGRWNRRVRVLVTGSAAALAVLSTTAQGATDDPRRLKVAVTVGDHSVTVGELEDRLAEIPPFQARLFGQTPGEITRAIVDRQIVHDLLLVAGAEKRHLGDRSPAKDQLQRARSTATLRALRATSDMTSPASVSMADVTKYYEDNRAKFDAPERINLWRILCKSNDEATTVLARAKGDLTIPKWNDLAREHSLDKATNFRGGNLGFIGPDGTSNEAGLKVDVALLKAASSVKDGDLVPRAVPEGGGFAFVWRRVTVAATKRSLDEAAPQIRTTIYRERTEGAEKKLIADLRAKYLRDLNTDPLKIVVVPPPDAGLTPRAR